ncbi:MAG: metal-dependent transcriptional regulator [Planctomycetota bacterium]|jgi:DtxR family Mn-dependent transcriptional regulator
MASRATEDYVKQIYLEAQRDDGRLVPMGRLADAMDVVPGTATAMARKLADARLVEYEPYTGVRLTAPGRRLALRVLRHHRLLETFLVETLGLDWSEVHQEADRLEHAISAKLLDRIDELLGHPSVDPHGDPIPDARGRIREPARRRLADCPPGTTCRIARVTDQDEPFLRFVDRHDLRPGRRIEVLSRDDDADAMVVRPHRGRAITMGGTAAGKLLVEV